MTLELNLEESHAVHVALCMNYSEQAPRLRKILDPVLLQMRKKEPSLLKTPPFYRPKRETESEEECSG